uniref:Uncharacterized protein n=1 Tax=Molossus molossus TaxID=27622 RepID=A0A7J8HHW1_MOLMO|nr:hypothetical protein HJG59_011084 [Molossus molossus]
MLIGPPREEGDHAPPRSTKLSRQVVQPSPTPGVEREPCLHRAGRVVSQRVRDAQLMKRPRHEVQFCNRDVLFGFLLSTRQHLGAAGKCAQELGRGDGASGRQRAVCAGTDAAVNSRRRTEGDESSRL